MSIDPYGKFGPLGKYGAYGKVGSIINLIGCIVLVVFGTVMIFTQGLRGGMPVWFAVLWIGVGVFLLWRFTKIARAVRRREREHVSQVDDGREDAPPSGDA